MDLAKLKSIIVLNKDTSKGLAKAIGISPQTLSAKMNERNGAEFTQGEIIKIRNRYDLNGNSNKLIKVLKCSLVDDFKAFSKKKSQFPFLFAKLQQYLLN